MLTPYFQGFAIFLAAVLVAILLLFYLIPSSAQHLPFMVQVHFDDNEELGTGLTKTSELFDPPNGLVGFHLNYEQLNC